MWIEKNDSGDITFFVKFIVLNDMADTIEAQQNHKIELISPRFHLTVFCTS